MIKPSDHYRREGGERENRVRYRVYDIFIVSASVTCASACIIGEEGREKERERDRERERERERKREEKE